MCSARLCFTLALALTARPFACWLAQCSKKYSEDQTRIDARNKLKSETWQRLDIPMLTGATPNTVNASATASGAYPYAPTAAAASSAAAPNPNSPAPAAAAASTVDVKSKA
jgi:hypothetical protein